MLDRADLIAIGATNRRSFDVSLEMSPAVSRTEALAIMHLPINDRFMRSNRNGASVVPCRNKFGHPRNNPGDVVGRIIGYLITFDNEHCGTSRFVLRLQKSQRSQEEKLPRKTITSALALMMAVAAPVAFAQSAAPRNTAPNSSRATHSSFTTDSGQLRASQLIGSTVYDVQNQNIGSVKDIVLGREGKVSAVVIDVGAFLGVGGKNVAVGLNDLKTTNDRLTLAQTKSQLQSAQPYHLSNDNNNK